MSTKTYFKLVMLGVFLVLISLGCMPVIWYFAKGILFAISVLLCLSALVFGAFLLYHTFGKYIRLVFSTREVYFIDQLEKDAKKLNDKIYGGKNLGYDQARDLLRSVYIFSRNPFFLVSQRKINACIRIIKKTCPYVWKIEVRSEFDVEEIREYLFMEYFSGTERKGVQIHIASLRYKDI